MARQFAVVGDSCPVYVNAGGTSRQDALGAIYLNEVSTSQAPYTLTADAGAFTITGVAVGLKAARKITCSAGSFAITANNATLTWSGAPAGGGGRRGGMGMGFGGMGRLGATHSPFRVATTQTFAETDVSSGFFGFFDTTTVAGRRKFYVTDNQNNSDWTGYIRGSSATMRVGGSGSTPFDISIDDGAWSTPTNAGTASDGTIILFSNLADAVHTVRIKCQTASSGAAWTFTGGVLFSVTGTSPSAYVDTATRWIITDPSFPGIHLVSLGSRPAGANVLPAISETVYTSAFSFGASMKFRAQCSEIYIFTAETEAFYSIDGAAMTQVALPLSSLGSYRAWKRVATGLDNTAQHNYVISSGGTDRTIGAVIGVMITGSGASFGTTPTTKKVIQYGDSITYAAGIYTGQTSAVQDIYKTGVGLGFLGAPCGLSGTNAAGLDSSLTTARSYRNVVEDVAVLAIGRNDALTSSASFKASVTSILNTLLGAGVGKILVRGQNFGGGGGAAVGGVANRDQDLADAVSALANANVVYVPVQTWTPITGVAPNNGLGDGTHPYGPGGGYDSMATYAIRDWAGTGFF